MAPYKLLKHKGIWYLADLDKGKIKTFSFSRIDKILFNKSYFQLDTKIEKRLSEEDGIWFGDKKIEFILKISSYIAVYFKRRKLISNQVIEKELVNGDLIVSAMICLLICAIPDPLIIYQDLGEILAHFLLYALNIKTIGK